MTAFTRILCPVDFSEFSRHALDEAVALARRCGGSVTALHVIPPPAGWYPPLEAGFYPYVYTPDDLAAFQRSLESFVADSAGAQVQVSAVSVVAPVVPEILDQAEARHCDLIVIGTHGRSGFERVILGSVAERVLAKARGPVLAVPRRHPDAVPFGAVPYPRILCPVDFSRASLQALHDAGELAVATGARLTLLHVLQPELRFEPVMMGGPMTPEFHQLQRDNARGQLRSALTADVRDRVRVDEVVLDGKPWEEVIRVAMEGDASLIVMGAHGGAPSVFGYGSTTNRVVREATCPVLCVRP